MSSQKPSRFLLSLNQVKIGYSKKALLEAISLDIFENNFLSIVGSNGSGKTTFIRTLLGLLPPVSGNIKRSKELRFGYVPQRGRANMAFPLTVGQVVMLGRVKRIGLLKGPKAEDREAVQQSLKDVSLARLKNSYIQTLSGGQFQRMLIARALASQPNVLVLDEPTTGMDIVAEHDFIHLIEGLKERLGLTIIMVTHDLASAAKSSDSLVVINGSERTATVGPPLEVLNTKRLSNLFHRPLKVVNVEDRPHFLVGDEEPS